jgi:hypothetical protein
MYVNNNTVAQLYEFDGFNFTLIPNPPNHSNYGIGYYGYPVEYNSKLYLDYRNNDGVFQMYRLVETTVSTEQNDIQDIDIYPNPTQKLLHIAAHIQDTAALNYHIINTLGKAVMAGSSNENEFSADVSTLPSGVYFIRLQSGSNISVKRFVRSSL